MKNKENMKKLLTMKVNNMNLFIFQEVLLGLSVVMSHRPMNLVECGFVTQTYDVWLSVDLSHRPMMFG